MGILALLVLLGLIVCWILVVVKMFQNAGALHGILGILCSLYAFIWGWLNAGKLNIRNIMLAWTVLIIIYLILGFAGGGFNYSYGVNPTGVTP
jgi:hypothetical protein